MGGLFSRLHPGVAFSPRLGVRHHHPAGPQAQGLGAGREDVPHQPATALGAASPEGPRADGGHEEGRMGAGEKRVRAGRGRVPVSPCEGGGAWPSAETCCAFGAWSPCWSRQQPLWFPPWGSTSPRGWRPLQGCLVGLEGGMGDLHQCHEAAQGTGAGRGPQSVPGPGPTSL